MLNRFLIELKFMDSELNLAEQIAKIVADLSPDLVQLICDEIDILPSDSNMDAVMRIIRHINNSALRSLLSQVILSADEKYHSYGPQFVSLALRSAYKASQFKSDKSGLELVWTGPPQPMSTLRRTDQVLSDLITSAKHSLMIVSFAVYKLPHIEHALNAAMDKGVSVRFIFESRKESKGLLSIDGFNRNKDSALNRAELYVWPLERRSKTESGRIGALHAKCAVADRETAFISSANLTAAALHLNMELGIIIHGNKIPCAIIDHFEGLIKSGFLRRE